jgi:hypothetical protein
MHGRFATIWLPAILLIVPCAVRAQAEMGSGQRALLHDPAPVVLPARPQGGTQANHAGEVSWAQNAVADPAPSPAEAAMPVEPEQQQGLLRRLLQIPRQPWPTIELFGRGALEVEYLTGFFRSPIFVTSTRETFFLPQFVRLGMVLNEPNGERRFLRGSLEALAEFDCLPVTRGIGTNVIGGSGILRYNLSWLGHRMVSYIQAGFGGSYSDAYLNPDSPTTSAFNFMTQAGVGGHFFLTRRLAFTSETNFYRISYPVQGGRNNEEVPVSRPGFNMIGGTFGFTYFFNR